MSIRILTVAHEAEAGLGRLAQPLREALPAGSQLHTVHPYLGQGLPADAAAEGYHALIVLGGEMAAWDDDVAPWLPATRTLLRQAVDRRLPTLGICLGAQLLALATGGQVRRGDAGVEVGICPVQLLPAAGEDPLLGAVWARLGPTVRSAQWHQDAVTALPEGALLLATGSRYPHQGFRVGPCAWGLRYHPEVTPQDWAVWMAKGEADLTRAGQDPRTLLREYHAAERELTALARAHARAFANVVVSAHAQHVGQP